MPILATFSTSGPATPVPVDDRRLDFRSIDGSDIIEWTGREWIIAPGIQGLSVPPRDIVTERAPGLEGARLREIRTIERSVVLPFVVFADDGDYRTLQRQLARVRGFANYRTNDYAADEGTFDLVAFSAAGERRLRCVYVDGMEGAGADGPGDFAVFDMQMLAVDPYWHGQEWSTPVVQLPASAPFLSNSPADAFPRAITPSVALGADMPVTVGGDVPSSAVIEITGPATATVISSPQGLSVTLGSIAAGHSVLIDTGRRRQVLTRTGSGPWAVDWSILGDSPRWRPLPPGEASISVEVTGATSATLARVYGTELWETAW